MISFRVRPRVRQYTNYSSDKVLECFARKIDSHECKLDGTILENHVIVKMPDELHKYYSPELQLEVGENYMKDEPYSERQEETMIRGFIGPKSTLWTLFMFFYIGFGAATLFGTILGSSQQMLDKAPHGYWIALGGALGIISTLIASQVGQKLGADQTQSFLNLIQDVFDECECTE
ncbi:MAG: hypothetical protein ABFS32_23060 [Bacteroidota bacterium]